MPIVLELISASYQTYSVIAGLGTHGIVQVDVGKHFTFVTSLQRYPGVHGVSLCANVTSFAVCAATTTRKLTGSVLSTCSRMLGFWSFKRMKGARLPPRNVFGKIVERKLLLNSFSKDACLVFLSPQNFEAQRIQFRQQNNVDQHQVNVLTHLCHLCDLALMPCVPIA